MRCTLWLGLVPLSLACSSYSPAPTPLPPVVLAHPPADPGGPPPVSDDVAVFAIRKLWVGDLNPASGSYAENAWKSLGFDIDGKATTKFSTDVCQLALGASPVSQVDGNGGIDNSFGENVMGIIDEGQALNQGLPGQQFLDSIAQGLVTDLIVVHGLGAAATASPLNASLVVAAPLGATPTWSTADIWPVDSSSLLRSDESSPLLTFPASYLVGGVFVAEPPSGDGEIALGIALGAPLVLPIRHVQIAMTLSPDGTTATAGTISGILPTDRLMNALEGVAEAWLGLPCALLSWDTIAQQIEQAQDILLDGTNNPSQPCSGISLGLGFEAVRVQMGPVAVVAPLGNVCTGMDAGP